MAPRKIKQVINTIPQSEGDGAKVKRSIGGYQVRNFDPFLLLDEFHVTKPAGFPSHPHRGMQTVTYMLDGSFKHRDNKGHRGTINKGDVQWMTAGRGIIHSEMPGPSNHNVGLQLWVNLAAKHKMTNPQYQELRASQIPTAQSSDGHVQVKVIAGECYGVESKVFTVTPTFFWDVNITKENEVFQQKIPNDYNCFIYVIEGDICIDNKTINQSSCVLLDGSGDSVEVESSSSSKGARFVVIGGKPLNESIVQHGPFVMNSEKEIMEAFRDYSEGKF